MQGIAARSSFRRVGIPSSGMHGDPSGPDIGTREWRNYIENEKTIKFYFERVGESEVQDEES